MPNPTPTFATDPLLTGNLAELYVRIGAAVTMDDDYKMPLASDLSFQMSGQTEQVGIYSESFDRASKNGLSGTFSAEVRGSPRNSIMKSIMDAVVSQGQSALGTFIFVRGPRDAWYGNCIVSGAQSSDPVRGAAAYTISFETTGEVFYEQDVDSIANTSVAVNTNVATVTTSASHGFVVGQSVYVYGVSTELGDDIVGVKVVATAPTGTTFTYATTGVGDGSAATPGFSSANL